jgi:hypothetical protein
MLKIEELSPETIAKISQIPYDRIIEKHEGYFFWKDKLAEPRELPKEFLARMPDYNSIDEKPQFLTIGKHNVLLPIGRKHHSHITILHHFLSEDHCKLVIYLKDSTYYEDDFMTGFMSICDLVEPENIYVATIYHEWFMTHYNDSND